jgi:hypothetical protein
MDYLAEVVEAVQATLASLVDAETQRRRRDEAFRQLHQQGMTIAAIEQATLKACQDAGLTSPRELGISRDSIRRALQAP